MTSSDSFPPVEGGGSLMLAWQIKDRRVLIVGGGLVASGRLDKVLGADATVTLIAPRAGLHPLVVHRIFDDEATKNQITYLDRPFSGDEDLQDVDIIMTAIDDVAASREIYALAHKRRIPINCADMPPECDYYFGSEIRRGPLQVMVSTGGKGPKIASIIRKKIEDALPDNVGDAIERVGALRAALRERAPGVGGRLGQQRMNWMIKVCEQWSLDELGDLDSEATQFLLDEGWSKDRAVPTYRSAMAAARRPVRLSSTHSQGSSRSIGFTLGIGVGAIATLGILVARRHLQN